VDFIFADDDVAEPVWEHESRFKGCPMTRKHSSPSSGCRAVHGQLRAAARELIRCSAPVLLQCAPTHFLEFKNFHSMLVPCLLPIIAAAVLS
jgi:hypothetical protein